jgi:hypothetical protein
MQYTRKPLNIDQTWSTRSPHRRPHYAGDHDGAKVPATTTGRTYRRPHRCRRRCPHYGAKVPSKVPSSMRSMGALSRGQPRLWLCRVRAHSMQTHECLQGSSRVPMGRSRHTMHSRSRGAGMGTIISASNVSSMSAGVGLCDWSKDSALSISAPTCIKVFSETPFIGHISHRPWLLHEHPRSRPRRPLLLCTTSSVRASDVYEAYLVAKRAL